MKSTIFCPLCWGLFLFLFSSCEFAPRQSNPAVQDLIDQARELKNHQPDSAWVLLEQAFVLAEKSGDLLAEADVLQTQAEILSLQSNYEASDSLLNKSLPVYLRLNDFDGISINYILRGNNFIKIMALDSADHYFRAALKIDMETADLAGLAIIYNNLGTIEDFKGNYVKAMNFYQKALPLYEQQGNLEMEGICYNNISILHHLNEDYREAIAYQNKAIAINKKIDNRYDEVMNRVCLANFYLPLDSLDQALEQARWSLALADSLDYLRGKLFALSALGDVYFERGDFAQSLDYYRQFKARVAAEKDPYMIAQIDFKVGQLMIKQGRTAAGIQLLDSVLQVYEELGINQDIMQTHQELAESYAGQAQFDQAFFHLQQSITFRDSIFNEEKAAQLNELETKYQSEKQRKELAEKDLALARHFNRNLLLLGMVLLAIIGMIGYARRSIRNKKLAEQNKDRAELAEKLAQKLEQENEEVIAQNKVILEELAALKAEGSGQQQFSSLLDKSIKLFDNHIYKYRDILYLESNDTSVSYFTVDEAYHTPTFGALKKMSKNLFKPPLFIQIHRKYLVNIFHVREVNKSTEMLTLTDGTELKIARPRKKEVIKIIEKYFAVLTELRKI